MTVQPSFALSPRRSSLFQALLADASLERSHAPPVTRTAENGRAPLSFAQERLWFLDQLQPGLPIYNLPIPLRWRGPLNVAALERSLNEIVRRHEALRTSFEAVDGRPSQVVGPFRPVPLPLVDLSGAAEESREAEVGRLTAQTALEPFNLATGPLLRFVLVRLAAADHLLLLTMHHIVGDGWSIGVLLRELNVIYEAYSSGRPLPLPELPIQYADFARWQRQYLAGDVLEQHLSYWRKQLEGAPAVLELPADRPRPAVQTFRGAWASFVVERGVVDKLIQLGRREGATLFMVLLAAFKTLLHRYTGQEDLVVGTPIANRNRVDIEGLIGFFVNTLVLRTRIGGDPSFRELLAEVRDVTLGAYAHQDLPFEKLVEELQPERSLSHNPLFQIMFISQNAPTMPAMPSDGADEERPEDRVQLPDTGTAKFDLTVSMAETATGLSGTFEYNTDLFDRQTVARMMEHFRTLLGGIAEAPGQRLSRLPLLTEAERRQLLVEWNATAAPFAEDACIHALFEAQVRRTPDAPAVRFADRELSYDALNSRANRLAHYLRTLGVGPEVRVGICLERSPDMVVGMLGVLKAGAAYVPLDPAYPPQRLAFMLQDAHASVLLTQQALRDELPDGGAQIVCIDTLQETVARYSPENPQAIAAPSNLAYVIYTSGSTGKPKGVAIEHASVVAFVDWSMRIFSPDDLSGVLASTSISFDISVFELFVPLGCGGEVILVNNVLDLLALVDDETISLVNTVPSAIAEVVSARALPLSVRVVNLAGEPLAHALARQILEPRDIRLFNLYGPSEDTVYSTFAPIERSNNSAPTIGRPIANTQIYILDRNFQPCPIGIPGDLYIGGRGLARGYINQPALTAEKFICNPFSSRAGARLYRTGDAARYLPDGNIEFLGRSDRQVKLRGFRIELGEIETALEQHPTVREAAVLVREDRPAEKRLTAYVVLQPGLSLDTSALRQALALLLPKYMVPALFVVMETFPLTPSGKRDYRAFPAPDHEASQTQYVAARTPLERQLAALWADVLGRSSVGINDNFFELGGHSLLVTQLVSRIRDRLGVDLPLRSVFDAPTIIGLAELIGDRQVERAPQAAPIRTVDGGRHPLSFAQERLWFLDQLEPGSPVYVLFVTTRWRGPLNVAALERSLNEIVRRHEALRTSFEAVDGRPSQVVGPFRPVPLPLVDLSGAAEESREAEVGRLTAQTALEPFNLATGPLLRFVLVRLAAADHLLLLTMHHIVGDGWSIGVLLRELNVIYEAYSSGRPLPLPELPIQYADFARWQRQYLAGDVLEQHLSYWRKQLEGAPAVLELPADRPRPAVQTFRGAWASFVVERGVVDKLIQLGRREGATLFMVLLAAFKTLLHRYTGQEDLVVGTPIANRNRVDIEGLIGFFVNTLVLRTRIGGDPSFRELLAEVRDVTLGAYAHQDLPFEKLVEELQPERSLSHNPLFQIMFISQNAPTMPAMPSDGADEERPEDRVQLPDTGTAKFDLTVSMAETATGLSGTFEYNTDLFDRQTVARMMEHFRTLLGGIAEAPGQRLSRLPLLTEAERRQLLVEWNATAAPFAEDACIHALFEAQVRRTPDAPAVRFADRELSYDALNSRANRLAHYLRTLGVGPEVRVGICLERSPDMVVGMLGVLKAGAAYVPLDPAYPPQRLAFMLQDAHASVLLTQQALRDELPDGGAQIVCIDTLQETVARYSPENPQAIAAPSNLAYVIYTSGSTGKPKGVAMPHRPLVNLVRWQLTGEGAPRRTLQLAAFSFDVSFQEMLSTWCSGGLLIMIPEEQRRDPAAVLRSLSAQRIERLFLTPLVLRQLAETFVTREEIPISDLREIIVAGELLELTDEMGRFVAAAGNCIIRNQYGPTESHVVTEFVVVGGSAQWRHLPPIGRPIANVRAYVLDTDRQPVPVGVRGSSTSAVPE